MMLDAMAQAPSEVLPSRFWEDLNRKNLRQLTESGYDNFKRTVATNYFTWLLPLRDPQLRFLLSRIPVHRTVGYLLQSFTAGRHLPFTARQSFAYTLYTLMLWHFVSAIDRAAVLDRLQEPGAGNPPRVYHHGRLISQDIANSCLEFMSIEEGGGLGEDTRTVLELGAGYGRTAYTILALSPHLRYYIADIPPALYICERYLADVLRDKRVFRFRPFSNYTHVRDELESSQIAFFLPHQLEMLPPGSVDLFINISSLHEMRMDQIAYYLGLVQKLVRRWVYLKEWKESFLPADGVVVRQGDYPIPKVWVPRFWRDCLVQTHFFEALFEIV